jgi:hypothetical protein
MLRAGVDPGLLDEVVWWQTDGLWYWSPEPLVAYLRVADDRTGRPVAEICQLLAERHDVTLDGG